MPPSQQLRFWAHELGGMAKTGLLYSPDSYDQVRCERMLASAAQMAALTVDAAFTPDRPYLADPADPPRDMSSLQRTMLRDAAAPGATAVYQ